MLRAWVLLGIVLCAACGDNVPLPVVSNLVVVAHEDDDLLFMQADLFDVIQAHEPTTILYVTAADAGNGLPFANARIQAAQAAYGLIAGSQDWSCSTVQITDHPVKACRLAAAKLTLLFLGYPDGGVSGERPNSLLSLWHGDIERAATISEDVTHYTRPELIYAVAQIISFSDPRVIRTLDVSGTHGADHADHMLVGALTLLAAAEAGSHASLISYRGYNVNFDPANLPEPIYDQVSLGMRAYEACVLGCGACGAEACPTLADARYANFLHRHYVVGFRDAPLSGALRTERGCVQVSGDRLTFGDCADAAQLRLERGGALVIGDRCVRMRDDGELRLADCDDGPDRYFLFDDEGHLWSGLPAPVGPNMATDHAFCLVADGGVVHGAVCGAHRDWRWELFRAGESSPRPNLGTPTHGRSVRLGDITGDGKADLCSAGVTGLVCAPGDGTGKFGPPARVGGTKGRLLIEPESLALGDVDGDGLVDACGRDAAGLRCATAASGFVAAAWSPLFAHTGSATASDRSLAIIEGKICGLIAGDVVCAARGATKPMVRSTWPMEDATLWPGDLDGDGAADWCVATVDGPACGLAAHGKVTTEGTPWGFSIGNQIEGSVATDGQLADSARAALADVSGDGRADLCVIVHDNVECALSQGASFGPRAGVLELPTGTTAATLWLGDLDGDGKADPCVDDGTSITCALSP